jgi:hypothetical protein
MSRSHLRPLVDCHDELGRARTEVVGRIHVPLLEVVVPGGAKTFVTRAEKRATPTRSCRPSENNRFACIGRTSSTTLHRTLRGCFRSMSDGVSV